LTKDDDLKENGTPVTAEDESGSSDKG